MICIILSILFLALTDMSWGLNSPVGFSVVLLDQNVYKQLITPEGQAGIRVEGLPIQVSYSEVAYLCRCAIVGRLTYTSVSWGGLPL